MSDKYNDPNIIVVREPTPSFDRTLPLKYWVDKRALDPANDALDFTYEVFLKPPHVGLDGQLLRSHLVLSRDRAAAANIPGPDVNLQGVAASEVSFPVRPLLPGEKLGVDAFGRIVDLAEVAAAAPAASADFSRLEAKINKILAHFGL